MFSTKPRLLIGLIGNGIQGSLAPEIHMSEGERHGMRHVYKLMDLAVLGLDASALPDLLVGAERAGFDGLAITHPFKQAVITHLHSLSEDARLLGAVNTVTLRDGRRTGHNTDWFGFSESFRYQMNGAPRNLLVQLGAGGAGSAVAHAALLAGVGRLILFDADATSASRVVAQLSDRHHGHLVAGNDLKASVAEADGLINATPVGTAAYRGTPLPSGFLRPDLWVIDIIYAPPETALLRRARALGARTLNGGGMVVFQAAEQFRLFTGVAPDVRRMWDAFAALPLDHDKQEF